MTWRSKQRLRIVIAGSLGTLCLLALATWTVTCSQQILIMPDLRGPGPYGVQLNVYDGQIYARWVVNRPGQRVRDDGWEFGVGRLWIGYSGTYQQANMVLWGVYYAASAPLWLCTALLAAYPLLYVARAVRARRLNPGPLCKNCGYNLTGNASGRCPECGTPVGRAKAGG